MLKTLRITSLVALALAVCGVILIIVFGLMGDGDVKAYLERPGITKQFENKGTEGDKKTPESPLVAQAQAFALRIDPPPPPKPPVTQQPTGSRPEVEAVQRERVAPPKPPKPTFSTKFDLLATVLCQSDPTRSMVLLKLGTGKEEWFWQGDPVGEHQSIDEVRDGSAVFSQDGQNPQEKFVPAKPQAQSLLKADATTSPRPVGPDSINIPSDAVSTVPQAAVSDRAAAVTRPNLSRAASTARTTASGRIQWLRTAPKTRTPQEQKASVEDSIQDIQGIMNRDDTILSEEQRKVENEAWTKLLSALQGEKEKLEPAVKASGNDSKTSESDDNKESKSNVQKNDPNQR